MTMITPSYLGETIEYSSLHACRSTLEDPTLEEVGQHFAVTRERIRQIEAKALRKLRHPSRSHRLRAFLDTSVHE